MPRPVAVRTDEPGCWPMGMIGFTVTGVWIYNALDDAGRTNPAIKRARGVA